MNVGIMTVGILIVTPFAFCNHLIFLNDLSHNFKCFIPDYDYPNLIKIICMKFQKEIVVDFFNVLSLLFKNVIF